MTDWRDAAGDPQGFGGETPAFTHQTVVATSAQMTGLGKRLAGLLAAGDLVVLTGPLGAGKTTLAQGIGDGLRVRGPVTSPTFVIARLHPSLAGGPDMVHADAYRLGSRAEVDDLDLDADLATAVTVVEWGEGLVEALAPSFLAVRIETEPVSIESTSDLPDDAPDQPRIVRIIGWGERWRDAAPLASRALSVAT